MSSILDALKKSEAERQRGVPPTLNTPILQRGQPAKSKRPAWLLPAVAAVALVAAWAGGLFDGGDSGDEAPVVTQAEPAATAVAEAPAQAPVAAVASSAPATPAAAEPAMPDAAPDAAPETAAVESPADPPRRRIGFGPFPPRPTSAPAAEAPAAAAPDVAAPDAAVATIDNPVPATPAAPATPATPAAQPPAVPAAPVTAATPASTGDDVPTYHELPFAVRRDIPALALTLHMYSDDPERRFAIINGVRVRDGQPIEGGVDVREIRPNGVVIRFKDTDFLLPARG